MSVLRKQDMEKFVFKERIVNRDGSVVGQDYDPVHPRSYAHARPHPSSLVAYPRSSSSAVAEEDDDLPILHGMFLHPLPFLQKRGALLFQEWTSLPPSTSRSFGHFALLSSLMARIYRTDASRVTSFLRRDSRMPMIPPGYSVITSSPIAWLVRCDTTLLTGLVSLVMVLPPFTSNNRNGIMRNLKSHHKKSRKGALGAGRTPTLDKAGRGFAGTKSYLFRRVTSLSMRIV